MTGGPSQLARVLKHVDATMAANDLAPEIIPAETIQADEHPTPRSVLSSIPARDFFAAVGITAVLWFIAAAVSVIFPGA